MNFLKNAMGTDIFAKIINDKLALFSFRAKLFNTTVEPSHLLLQS